MSKNRAKFFIFVGALTFLIPVALLAFALLSSFIAAFNSGADPASIFRGHRLYVPTAEQAVWISTTAQGNTPTIIELEEMIAAYWLAWEALARAHDSADLSDLPTYWAGDALDHARAAAHVGEPFMHSGHQLHLMFFGEDSSVALIRDEDFVYTLLQAGDPLVLNVSAEVVMTLDNGFWRIRQYSIDFS